jgi:serpin B
MIRIAGRTIAVLSLFQASIVMAQQPRPIADRTPAEQARLDVGPLVRASNHAGADLFSRLQGTTGNLACSPYALTETLALIANGSKSATQLELHQVLPPLNDARLQGATLALIKELAAENPIRPGEQRRNGTGLWTAANTRYAPELLTLAKNYYPEGLNSVAANDSIRAAAPAEYAQDMTAIDAGRDAATPPALLVSNAGFKGVWAYPFPLGSTKEGAFGDKKAQFMRQRADFGYAETPELQIVELPYADRDLRLMILVPRNAAGLADVEKSLTLQRLTLLSSGLIRREVDVTLPRFQVVLRLKLRAELEKLGIKQAFTQDAQFTGLTVGKQPRLEQVIQEVSFEVDEGYGPKGPLPMPAPEKQEKEANVPAVKADHPFLFVLRDMSRGGIVFIGRITEPATAAK